MRRRNGVYEKGDTTNYTNYTNSEGGHAQGEKSNQERLKVYEKGSFIYRLAGRDREKSASYYTPEVLTTVSGEVCLEGVGEGKAGGMNLLKILICEMAQGSAAFLNEAVNQIAELYLELKQKETGIEDSS